MKNKNFGLLVIIALVFIVGVSGCQQQAAEQAGESTGATGGNIEKNITSEIISGTAIINITNFAFSPSEITITKGSRIIWKNLDSVKHSVTFDSNQFYFINYNLQPGQEASDYFNYVGTYNYHCSIHPSMKGKIIVQ